MCVVGDKGLIRLRDFALDKACKKDAERVIGWLKVSLYHSQSHSFIGYKDLSGML